MCLLIVSWSRSAPRALDKVAVLMTGQAQAGWTVEAIALEWAKDHCGPVRDVCESCIFCPSFFRHKQNPRINKQWLVRLHHPPKSPEGQKLHTINKPLFFEKVEMTFSAKIWGVGFGTIQPTILQFYRTIETFQVFIGGTWEKNWRDELPEGKAVAFSFSNHWFLSNKHAFLIIFVSSNFWEFPWIS